MLLRPLFALSVLFAASCASTDTPTGDTWTWRCDNGVTFTSQNTTGGNAEVVAHGHNYRLPGVIAGSGVRYSNGRVEFWEHGGEAMLNGAAGGPYENCRNTDN